MILDNFKIFMFFDIFDVFFDSLFVTCQHFFEATANLRAWLRRVESYLKRRYRVSQDITYK